MPSTQQQQIHGLTSLLHLEQLIRNSKDIGEFGFVVTNKTQEIVNYRQAVFWKTNAFGEVRIVGVSGVDVHDPNSPFIIWLQTLFNNLLESESGQQQHQVTSHTIDEKMRKGWHKWCQPHGLWCPFVSSTGNISAGLWFNRDAAWIDEEQRLLVRLIGAYAFVWSALTLNQTSIWHRFLTQCGRKRLQLLVITLCLSVLCLPVRMSVLAPAEVASLQPHNINAPIKGVIKQFFVQPNQWVEKHQLLFELDDTLIRNQHEIAKKTLDVAVSEYQKTRQAAFGDSESKAKVDLFYARVQQKIAEKKYALKRLEQIRVYASHAGIAGFTDVNDWIGKPLVIGEKVMILSDPIDAGAEIWLAIDDAINLAPGADIQVFLNIEPTNPLPAKLLSAAFKAQLTPSDTLAFQLKGAFIDKTKLPRIGLRGVAKIYGREVRIAYYLVRRPLAALRQWFGW